MGEISAVDLFSSWAEMGKMREWKLVMHLVLNL